MSDGRDVRVLMLGSTGSIGVQTEEVIAHLNRLHEAGRHPHRYRIVGLAAGRNADRLAEQAERWGVNALALAAVDVEWTSTRPVLRGPDAAEQLVSETDADIVLGAMVGFAGVPALLTAVRRGMTVALANKETLVAAGALIVEAAMSSGAHLLPVDSEHSGVWQCLASAARDLQAPPTPSGEHIRRITLTASGGALRTWDLQRMFDATPEEALAHPTWDMGAKVTVDSASLTNKALELVEAHWLFGIDADHLGVLIHPQSIVHAFVEFVDGSMIAQLGAPDMRTPIQVALTWPERIGGLAPSVDVATLANLDFEAVDGDRFPALASGFDVIRRGGTSGAVFNAANERAVEAFLAGSIPFGRIPELSRAALDEVSHSEIRDQSDVMDADREARSFVDTLIGPGAATPRGPGA